MDTGGQTINLEREIEKGSVKSMLHSVTPLVLVMEYG